MQDLPAKLLPLITGHTPRHPPPQIQTKKTPHHESILSISLPTQPTPIHITLSSVSPEKHIKLTGVAKPRTVFLALYLKTCVATYPVILLCMCVYVMLAVCADSHVVWIWLLPDDAQRQSRSKTNRPLRCEGLPGASDAHWSRAKKTLWGFWGHWVRSSMFCWYQWQGGGPAWFRSGAERAGLEVA